jgi:hypothetical protein
MAGEKRDRDGDVIVNEPSAATNPPFEPDGARASTLTDFDHRDGDFGDEWGGELFQHKLKYPTYDASLPVSIHDLRRKVDETPGAFEERKKIISERIRAEKRMNLEKTRANGGKPKKMPWAGYPPGKEGHRAFYKDYPLFPISPYYPPTKKMQIAGESDEDFRKRYESTKAALLAEFAKYDDPAYKKKMSDIQEERVALSKFPQIADSSVFTKVWPGWDLDVKWPRYDQIKDESHEDHQARIKREQDRIIKNKKRIATEICKARGEPVPTDFVAWQAKEFARVTAAL